MVTRFSSAEPGPGSAPAGVPGHAPVLRASDCFHDIESVGTAVFARPGVPWAAGVFYFDPDVVQVDFGTEGEFAAVAGGAVHDGIGANSEAIRIASPARGQSRSRVASAARACLTWAGSAR